THGCSVTRFIQSHPALAAKFSGLDPQVNWYEAHSTILSFLSEVPASHQMRVRSEDVLMSPDRYLRDIASWLRLRSDLEGVSRMKRPEASPFAEFGPPNAPNGADPDFLQAPVLRAYKPTLETLDSPLPWQKDGKGFTPEVRRLAREFGYE